MKDFKNISPIAFALIMLAIFSVIILLPVDMILLKMSFSDFQAEYIGLSVKMTFVLAVSYRIIKKLNIENIIGLSSKDKWRYKSLNLIPIYLIILGVLGVISKDLTQIDLGNLLLLLFACLSVGFAEEFLFRGVLQSLFLKQYGNSKNGLLVSVLVPALIFGLFHLVNLTKSGSTLAVLVQVVFALFIGFFFGVLVLRTNKIVPVAITHGLINFFFSLALLPALKVVEDSKPSAEISALFTPILLTLPLFIIGLFVLRKVKMEEVLKKVDDSFN